MEEDPRERRVPSSGLANAKDKAIDAGDVAEPVSMRSSLEPSDRQSYGISPTTQTFTTLADIMQHGGALPGAAADSGRGQGRRGQPRSAGKAQGSDNGEEDALDIGLHNPPPQALSSSSMQLAAGAPLGTPVMERSFKSLSGGTPMANVKKYNISQTLHSTPQKSIYERIVGKGATNPQVDVKKQSAFGKWFSQETEEERQIRRLLKAYRITLAQELPYVSKAKIKHQKRMIDQQVDYEKQEKQLIAWGLRAALIKFHMQGWFRLERCKQSIKLAEEFEVLIQEKLNKAGVYLKQFEESSNRKGKFSLTATQEFCKTPDALVLQDAGVLMRYELLRRLDFLSAYATRQFVQIESSFNWKDQRNRRDELYKILHAYNMLPKEDELDNIETDLSWTSFCNWMANRTNRLIKLQQEFFNLIEDQRESEGRLFYRWRTCVMMALNGEEGGASSGAAKGKRASEGEERLAAAAAGASASLDPTNPNKPSALKVTPKSVQAFIHHFATAVVGVKYNIPRECHAANLALMEALFFNRIGSYIYRYADRDQRKLDEKWRLHSQRCRLLDPRVYHAPEQYLERFKEAYHLRKQANKAKAQAQAASGENATDTTSGGTGTAESDSSATNTASSLSEEPKFAKFMPPMPSSSSRQLSSTSGSNRTPSLGESLFGNTHLLKETLSSPVTNAPAAVSPMYTESEIYSPTGTINVSPMVETPQVPSGNPVAPATGSKASKIRDGIASIEKEPEANTVNAEKAAINTNKGKQSSPGQGTFHQGVDSIAVQLALDEPSEPTATADREQQRSSVVGAASSSLEQQPGTFMPKLEGAEKEKEVLPLERQQSSGDPHRKASAICSTPDRELSTDSAQHEKDEYKPCACYYCSNLSLSLRLQRFPNFDNMPDGREYARSARVLSWMTTAVTPREMILCISLACKWLLRDAVDVSGSREFIGADLMVPLLGMVLIHAQIPNIHMLLYVINVYGDYQKHGDISYYLDTIVGLTSFFMSLEIPPETEDIFQGTKMCASIKASLTRSRESRRINSSRSLNTTETDAIAIAVSASQGTVSGSYSGSGSVMPAGVAGSLDTWASNIGMDKDGYEKVITRAVSVDSLGLPLKTENGATTTGAGNAASSTAGRDLFATYDDKQAIHELEEWLRDQKTMEDTIAILQSDGWML